MDRRPVSLGDRNKGSDSYRQSADVFCAEVTKYKSGRASGQQGSGRCLEQPEKERSLELNKALKALFFTIARLNISLHLSYIPSGENLADAPSRRFLIFDNKLSEQIWYRDQEEFGGDKGQSCDLMSLDLNAMKDRMGNSLPHFAPVPSPDSAGVNLFAQDVSQHSDIMFHPYVFPPSILVGPVLKFLGYYGKSLTLAVMDTFPRKYWWPIVTGKAVKVRKLASMGDTDALLLPSKHGWVPHKRGFPGDLWAFAVHF